MGMKKGNTETPTATLPVVTPPESGTPAAVARLTTPKVAETKTNVYKPRDFDAEARGKTRCATWNAAMMSPALAGLKFKDIDGYLDLVRKAAEAGVKYSFQD